MKNTLFKEKRQFNDKLTLVVLGLFCAASLFGAFNALLRSNKNTLVAVVLFVAAVAIGLLIWWLMQLKLKFAFNTKSITFKMSPVHVKKKVLFWKDIEKYEIIETSKAAQWSGGNITFKQEKRFSLTGRNGLALKTKKGSYFLIGCQDIEALKIALAKIDK